MMDMLGFGKSWRCFSITCNKICFCSSWIVRTPLNSWNKSTLLGCIVDDFQNSHFPLTNNIVIVIVPQVRTDYQEMLWYIRCSEKKPGDAIQNQIAASMVVWAWRQCVEGDLLLSSQTLQPWLPSSQMTLLSQSMLNRLFNILVVVSR